MGPPKTILTLQALRALAAASVVIYHTLFMLRHNAGYAIAVPDLGATGVDLFFVISGFIMVYTTHDLFGQRGAVLPFLRRRAIRIAPTYWLYTTVVVLLLAFAPRLFQAPPSAGGTSFTLTCSCSPSSRPGGPARCYKLAGRSALKRSFIWCSASS